MMARSIRYSGEIEFEPLHSDKVPPSCEKCRRITYTVYQATCCGAYFCETCKKAQSQSVAQFTTCPRCQGKLGEVYYDFNETHRRDQYEVYCRNKRAGCTFKDQRGLMNDHLFSCLYETVPCKHEKCTQRVFRKDLQKHEETCPDRMVHCQYCKAPLRAIHLNQYHLSTGCQDFPKDCPNKCGAKITDRKLSQHKEICPCEPIPCVFAKYGCSETVQRNHVNRHLSEYLSKHLEILLQKIENLQTNHQASQQTSQHTIWSLQTEVQKLHNTIQSLQAEMQLLNNNYSQLLREDVGRLAIEQSHNRLQTQVSSNHLQLVSQVNIMERDFQFHKKAFENFVDNCKMIQDGITQANATFPLKFIINNTEELIHKGEGHPSPYFYTECRKHKLRLTVFPGGKGNDKGHCISVWLHRISNYGVQKKQLPERVKVQVVIELLSQLPHTTEADNFVINIDTIVHQNQQEEVIFEKNDFIPIRELDYTERRRKFSFVRHTQYKMANSLVFQVRSAVEGVL